MTQISKSATGRERGWVHIVNQIVQATEQSSFLHGMLQAQCSIVAADYGAIWVVDDQNQIEMAQTWPTRLADQKPDAGVVEMLKQAAGSGTAEGVVPGPEITIRQRLSRHRTKLPYTFVGFCHDDAQQRPDRSD